MSPTFLRLKGSGQNHGPGFDWSTTVHAWVRSEGEVPKTSPHPPTHSESPSPELAAKSGLTQMEQPPDPDSRGPCLSHFLSGL